ncbi:MAG: YitT family protein [Chitinophagales bacterium]|nr:YitT family protein [Chitinophagales bacterium]
MKRLIGEIIRQKVLHRKREYSSAQVEQFSSYQLAKAFRELRITVYRSLKDAFLITLGILSASVGLKSFLIPNGFIDGGAMGVSLLVFMMTKIPLPVLIIGINLPFMIIGLRVISWQFALKSTLAITGLAITSAVLPLPPITSDKLLISVFGGFFLGTGIGLSVRGGAVIDGTEVLAIYLSRKMGVTIGDVILFINLIIFSVAAYLLSIEVALYSVLTYMAASKSVDFVIEGIEEYTGVTIVSVRHTEILQMIKDVMGRGATVYRGRTGFGKRGEQRDADIVFTVVTRLEISKLNSEIEKIDPNAFVVMSSIKDTKGGMIKKRPIPH